MSEAGMTGLDGAPPPLPFPAGRKRRLHPAPVRIMHWVNALAIIIMIGSGWRIYMDEPIFGWIKFPGWISLGGDVGLSLELRGNPGASGALQWHFLGMWLLVLNGAAYLTYGFATGRFRRRLWPIRPRDVLREVGEALRFRLAHDDLTVNNSVQRLLYAGVMVAVVVQVLAGLAIWKPIQLWWLTAAFGGFQSARLIHFLGMSAIVGFLVVHVLLTLLVPRTLVAMVGGGPVVDEAEEERKTRASEMPAPQPGE